jgi:hypothetical protein
MPGATGYSRFGITGHAMFQAALTAVMFIGGLAIIERLYYWLRAAARSRTTS